MAKRRLIVLGCGGFVGSHLVDRLLASGEFEVFGYDLTSKKCAQHLDNPDFHFREGYVDSSNTEEVLGDKIGDVEAIFSLAAVCNPAEYVKNPVFTINSNFIHAYKLVDLCTEAGTWLIHTSTCEVYGRTIASYLDGELSFSDLWRTENVHRIFFPKLVMLPLARATSWNHAYEVGVIVVLAGATYAMILLQLAKLHRDDAPPRSFFWPPARRLRRGRAVRRAPRNCPTAPR